MADPCTDFRLSAEEQADGWKLLSDTSAKAQWQAGLDLPFPAQGWTVRGTCLELSEPRGGGSLHSAKAYQDFDLRWEWEIAPGGDSGVRYLAEYQPVPPDLEPLPEFIAAASGVTLLLSIVVFLAGRLRYKHRAAAAGFAMVLLAVVGLVGSMRVNDSLERQYYRDVVGLEYQLLDDSSRGGGTSPKQRTGSLYDILPGQAPVSGLSHSSRIVVAGGKVQHWLDGALVLEYAQDSQAFQTGLQQTSYRDVELEKRRKGRLQLRNQGSRVVFQNVRIREGTAK
ncbi:MAG: DUF1080 domain-containing protein [Bryobacterales bacterium]|nr:DUF1080 domain-containing protein [Bryobacterales bacterium]